MKYLESQLQVIGEFINDCIVIDINKEIKDITIEIRKDYNLKLPDYIIAAIVRFMNLLLITADSRWDKTVQLHYKKYGKYFVCVVVKMENSMGFLITIYLTTKKKVGEELWRK